MAEHDVIVIGAGPAGEVCSARLAEEGLDVVLVERELVGGECAYWACMPSKALLRPAELLAETQRVPGAREASTKPLDVDATLKRRDEVIRGLDDAAQLKWIEQRKIHLHRGHARLDGERCVQVGGQRLDARRAVVIATGTAAAVPPIPGLQAAKPWTNREGTTAKEPPGSLIVLGAGAVGCELAQAWRTLGSAVTLVEALPTILHGEEPFATEQLHDSLTHLGVSIRTGARATKAHRDASGTVTLTLQDGETLTADELLVAAGRKPHTDDLGLETIGLEPGATISTNDRLQVPGKPWLYAIGDVNGRALLTHAAKYQAHVVAATIMNRSAAATYDGAQSPRVVFTEPQIAAVGQTLQQALDAGTEVRAVDVQISRTPGASFVGKGAPASARIVVDAERDVIVGATFTGPEVAEMLHAATVAIVGEVPLSRLVHAMPAFPTRSELWLKLVEDWLP